MNRSKLFFLTVIAALMTMLLLGCGAAGARKTGSQLEKVDVAANEATGRAGITVPFGTSEQEGNEQKEFHPASDGFNLDYPRPYNLACYMHDDLLATNGENPVTFLETHWFNDGGDVIYEKSFPLSKDGKLVKLRLSVLEADEGCYSGKALMEFFMDDKKFQSVTIEFGLYGVGIDVLDVNFDGYTDIMLAPDSGGSAGRSYWLYRYDPSKEQFVGTDISWTSACFYPEQNIFTYTGLSVPDDRVSSSFCLARWRDGNLVQLAEISAEETSDYGYLVSCKGQQWGDMQECLPPDFFDLPKDKQRPYLNKLDRMKEKIRARIGE
ncbi:MAG: hypothetical protein IJR93_14125 [Treponema sp.]|nr:hypothetical protein [Treponema sp.]